MPFWIDTLDDEPIYEQCPSFSGGQVSFSRANVLSPNQASYLQNCYIHISGQIRKRRGTRNLEDGFVSSSGQRVQSLFRFKTPSVDKLLAVANGNFWEFNESTEVWVAYFTSSISDINLSVAVAQLSDNIWWADPASSGVRRWNGTTVSTVASSPVGTLLESFTNRLIVSGVSSVPDGVYFSDILDGTVWNVLNILRVGANGDPVVAIKGWQDTSLLVFKEKSTYIVDIDPEISVADMSIDLIHSSVGCVAKRSICQIGQDIYFLSRNGVVTIQKQIGTSNNIINIPLSQSVQDVIAAIRWEHAYKSCAIFYNNHYILAVPINSNEPDVALVYSVLTQSWAGVYLGLTGVAMLEQPHQGRTRMLVGTSDGQVREALDYLLESEETSDVYTDGFGGIMLPFTIPATLPGSPPVVSIVRTRAMEFGSPVYLKTGFYIETEFLSKDGSFQIYAILDGGEPTLLSSFLFNTSPVLPQVLPFNLGNPKWRKKKFSIHQLGQFREIQIEIRSLSGNMILRNIIVSAFLDSVELREESEVF